MGLEITPSDQACGASIRGVDISKHMDGETISAIRAAWLKHRVLAFPNQQMSDDALEQFTLQFGPFGDDPFIAPIPGREHIIAVKRDANETSPIFAESWHTDWSFQVTPPAGTCLYGIEIPPSGGDTLFADQVKALAEMPDELRYKIEGRRAIHSAKNAYAKDGAYGDGDVAARSMDIRPSDDAAASHIHPLIRIHPETGEEALYGAPGYITGIEDMEQKEGWALLAEVYRWQTRPEFQYRHKWEKDMLLMWDNRALLHMATGGYAGHARRLHRTTIGAR